MRVFDAGTQQRALEQLGRLTQRATVDPYVRGVALLIINQCQQRDDACELHAIYDAVKSGREDIPPLRYGIKYVADPRFADYFTAPGDTLRAAERGANGGDCDDHSALVAGLCGAVGWKVGLRAYGPREAGGFIHVYPVVAYPKRGRPVVRDGERGIEYDAVYGMDTTVDEAHVGWEPPSGNVLTCWLD